LGQNLHASIPPTWSWIFVRQIHVIAFYLLISINFQVSSLVCSSMFFMKVMRVKQQKAVRFAISFNHLRLEVSPCHRCSWADPSNVAGLVWCEISSDKQDAAHEPECPHIC
jgi:hypothetical protein